MRTDTPAQDDLLNRKKFATSIASGILTASMLSEDGFVVGITGKWGSGKSTLLSYIREALQENTKRQGIPTCFISFNPWMFSEEENIRKSFLRHFLFSINASIKEKRGRVRRLNFLWQLSKKIGVKKLWDGELSNDLGSLLKKYIERDTSLHYKNDIDQQLSSSGQKIFVFIDDIDRLYPKQVFEILQVLKLTGNFKNTYYVIAFDREAVEISIETQFKGYGNKYLDKIIQADFVIPEVPDEILEQLFFDTVSGLMKNLNITLNTSELSSVWLHKGLRHYFRTLRDIYRYINSIELTLPHIAPDINVVDFLVIEAIRLHDFEAYQFIYTKASLSFKTYEQQSSVLDSNTLENEHSSKLLRYLFENSDRKNENAKRLRDPAFFDRYFTLQIRDKDISEDEFKMLIESQHREQVLRNALQYGRLNNLLIRLNDTKILDQYSNWTFSLIRDLYEFLDNNALELEPYINSYTDALTNLLTVKENERDQFFNDFLNLMLSRAGTRLSYIKIYFLHFMVLDAEQETRFSPNSLEFKAFYKRKHTELKEEYVKYLKDWKGHFGSTPIDQPLSYFTTLFLYDYARFLSDDYIKNAESLVQKDNALLVFIKNIVSINALDGKAYELNENLVNLYLPGTLYQTFLWRLKNMDTSLLKPDQKQWREFILNREKARLS